MNRTASTITISLLVGLIIGILIGMGRGSVEAQGPPAGSGNLGSHHKDVEITMLFGETRIIPIPVTDRPVHVDFSVTNVIVASTGQVAQPMINSGIYFYDSVNNLSIQSAGIGRQGLNCGDVQLLLNDMEDHFTLITVNPENTPACREDIPIKVNLNMWY